MGESAAAHLETTQDQRHQTSVGRQWNHLKTLLLVAVSLSRCSSEQSRNLSELTRSRPLTLHTLRSSSS